MSSKLLTAACALSLLCGTSAFAAEHHGGGGAPHGGGGGAPHGGGGAPHAGGGGGFHGGGGAPRVSAAAAFHGGGAAHVSAPARVGGGFRGAPGGVHTGGVSAGAARFGGAGTHTASGGYHGAAAGGHHGGARGGSHIGAHLAVAGAVAGTAVAASMVHGSHHYSAQAYPHEINTGRQYHYQGAWRPPGGWHYQRWGYGQRLPRGWFARDFWITNFWAYGLPMAPYGYAWVREGPDAVLVNVYTGMVVEVDYGVFY